MGCLAQCRVTLIEHQCVVCTPLHRWGCSCAVGGQRSALGTVTGHLLQGPVRGNGGDVVLTYFSITQHRLLGSMWGKVVMGCLPECPCWSFPGCGGQRGETAVTGYLPECPVSLPNWLHGHFIPGPLCCWFIIIIIVT